MARGWHSEPGRHAQAARGIETSKGIKQMPGSFRHKFLHKALTETLAELRRDGVTSLDNLEFYSLVREREGKLNKDSNRTIASYLRTHSNEFKVKYDEERRDRTVRKRRIHL